MTNNLCSHSFLGQKTRLSTAVKLYTEPLLSIQWQQNPLQQLLGTECRFFKNYLLKNPLSAKNIAVICFGIQPIHILIQLILRSTEEYIKVTFRRIAALLNLIFSNILLHHNTAHVTLKENQKKELTQAPVLFAIA